jgi:hypothetical protein
MIKTGFKLRTTNNELRTELGSALIIAVILTSLLAIIGMMFVMMARVDRMATSAISDNKALDSAVEAVVVKISQELVSDVPGVSGQEYYDYPGDGDKWLASIEPYDDSGTYRWRQISDVTGYLKSKNIAVQHVLVDPPGTRTVIQEYPDITLDNNGDLAVGNSDDGEFNNESRGQLADADGDGIADAKWIELGDITTGKGKPIYAAIRVIDNGAMLNVNTAYEFNPSGNSERIDGSSQTQINLKGLLRGGDTIADVNDVRNPDGNSFSEYQDGLVWRIEDPCYNYQPFDISDELELKYRYCIDSKFKSRIEAAIPDTTDAYGDPGGLYDASSNWGLSDWQQRITDPYYSSKSDRRHMLTTYNMDRIIDPCCTKMVNINDANAGFVYEAIVNSNPGITNAVAAQIAVNLVDFRDKDDEITHFSDDGGVTTYYGFESPCIYISELAQIFLPDTSDPSIVYRSYAIELYKPYTVDEGDPDPDVDWQLVISGIGGTKYKGINWSDGSKHFCVMRFEDPATPVSLSPPLLPATFAPDPGYSHVASDVYYDDHFNAGDTISLVRRLAIGVVNGEPVNVDVVVDSITVPAADSPPGWLSAEDGVARSIQRDISQHRCIRRLWDNTTRAPDLGVMNAYVDATDTLLIQAHPANRDFNNVGEIGMLFRKSAYEIDSSDTEATCRLNLEDPCYQNLFQYLTVFDPNSDGINNDGDRRADLSEIIDGNDLTATPEWKVPGRININTAPWFVLAQLPWVSQRVSGTDDSLAQAIVAYRDKVDLSSAGGPDYTDRSTATAISNLREEPGFASIGELNFVIGGSANNYRIDDYALDSGDLTGFPDLTTLTPSSGDGAPDDFEERDVIFSRISNLVTVRSDIFTAYILVRIGTDGPQKRVMAILDRSNVYSPADKVRIIALHPVPDPR